MNEISNIIRNTILALNQKYGDNYCRKIEVGSNVKFFDKIKNKTKNSTIKNYRGVRKTIVASKGVYEFVKVNTLSILIEGNIYKIVINT